MALAHKVVAGPAFRPYTGRFEQRFADFSLDMTITWHVSIEGGTAEVVSLTYTETPFGTFNGTTHTDKVKNDTAAKRNKATFVLGIKDFIIQNATGTSVPIVSKGMGQDRSGSMGDLPGLSAELRTQMAKAMLAKFGFTTGMAHHDSGSRAKRAKTESTFFASHV